jgi:hypothetical protein
MPLLSTAQEYASIREALQLFSQGKATASVTIDGMTVSYQATQADYLMKREKDLAMRLSVRNVRKRTRPDFSL